MTIRLSEDQQRVVDSSARAIVVVAGAGSGKTEVLARRLERLLALPDSGDDRVLALSYTVKAADELQARLRERLGDHHRRVEAQTVHGFAHDLLRRYGTRIGLPIEPEVLAREEDRLDLLAFKLQESGQDPRSENLGDILTELDLVRARMADGPYLRAWREALADAGAVDYPAMIERAAELVDLSWVGRQIRILYRIVAVDEAQNLTAAQYELIRRVLGPETTDRPVAILVGDERQSIVGFAGADRSLIGRFEKEFDAERIELHTNFRSAARIVALGRAVAEELELPVAVPASDSFPARGEVSIVEVDSEAEEAARVSQWIQALVQDGLPQEVVAPGESARVALEDIAVLARSAAALRYTRTELQSRGVPYAMASTPDGWVRSSAAMVALAVVAFLSAPAHGSTRRQIVELADVHPPNWDDLAGYLSLSGDPAIVAVASLAEADNPAALVEVARELDVRDEDWMDDLGQIEDAWASFVDRYGPDERSFGNFKQHIARTQRGDALARGVRLLTVHKAQGREFKAVALIACNGGQIPDFRAVTPEQQQDELRTFYVAVSRPSRLLLLTRAKIRQTRYNPRPTEPSPYLAIAAKLIADWVAE